MATNPVGVGSPAPTAGTTPASGAASSSGADTSESPEATKQEFISLLVAQLQNQDPLNPSDGTQFLSQLTEINSFEQLLYIRQDLDTLSGDATATTGSTGSTGSGDAVPASTSAPASSVSGSQN
jgi:flagellar basal-body rod modification protein FlgD